MSPHMVDEDESTWRVRVLPMEPGTAPSRRLREGLAIIVVIALTMTTVR